MVFVQSALYIMNIIKNMKWSGYLEYLYLKYTLHFEQYLQFTSLALYEQLTNIHYILLLAL